jgi:hypothetical protein
MMANEIIDNIADRLGYARTAFKDVVPTKSRFDALLGTLTDLTPQQISEARSAYDTYIASERRQSLVSADDESDNENEGQEISEETQNILNRLNDNQNEDLSEILNQSANIDGNIDLSNASPRDEDVQGQPINDSSQLDDDTDEIYKEETQKDMNFQKGQSAGGKGSGGDGKGKSDGEGEGDGDGDGDGDGEGDGEGEGKSKGKGKGKGKVKER